MSLPGGKMKFPFSLLILVLFWNFMFGIRHSNPDKEKVYSDFGLTSHLEFCLSLRVFNSIRGDQQNDWLENPHIFYKHAITALLVFFFGKQWNMDENKTHISSQTLGTRLDY